MRFKLLIVISGYLALASAYTQGDLLAAQYDYQSASDKVTQAKQEKSDASAALAKAKKKLDQAKKDLQQAQQEMAMTNQRYAKAESNLILRNHEFGTVNVHLNQVWNSLNSKPSNN